MKAPAHPVAPVRAAVIPGGAYAGPCALHPGASCGSTTTVYSLSDAGTLLRLGEVSRCTRG